MPYHRADTSAQADKLSGIVEESDLYEGFAPHVETSEIKTLDFYNLPKQTGEFMKWLLILFREKLRLYSGKTIKINVCKIYNLVRMKKHSFLFLI